jgi:hypothetical protein
MQNAVDLGAGVGYYKQVGTERRARDYGIPLTA